MEPDVVVRALHVLTGALWAGSAIFMAFVLGPSIMKAGPAAGPFMATVLRRGGLTPFFLPVGLVSVLSGGYIYSKLGYAEDPFANTSTSVLTVGMLFAVLAILVGFLVLLPNELRMKRLLRSLPPGPPPPDAAAKLQAMGAKQGKSSAAGAALIAVALVCMVLRPVLA